MTAPFRSGQAVVTDDGPGSVTRMSEHGEAVGVLLDSGEVVWWAVQDVRPDDGEEEA